MTRNLDDDQQTDVRIMEFSKALDKVSHNFLTHKLKHYGMRGKVNNWIESFLSGHCWGCQIYIPPCRFWSAPGFSPGTKYVFILYKRHPHWTRLHYNNNNNNNNNNFIDLKSKHWTIIKRQNRTKLHTYNTCTKMLSQLRSVWIISH